MCAYDIVNIRNVFIVDVLLTTCVGCLKVFHNIEGDDNWSECFNAPNVDLPTGYYFGFTAATGDLAGMFFCLLVCLLS